jgi:antitoxin VapB
MSVPNRGDGRRRPTALASGVEPEGWSPPAGGASARTESPARSGDTLAIRAYPRYVYPNWIYLRCTMTSSTVFISNRSQAVRLPKPVAFPEDVHQVDILKIGRSRVIVPQGKRWDDLFLSGPRVSEDFMSEREQAAAEEREPF